MPSFIRHIFVVLFVVVLAACGGGDSSSGSLKPPAPVDTDNDGVNDNADAFPNDPNETSDMDGDGVGDNSDPDLDGDNVNNEEDAFPADKSEWVDTDSDGLGNNADTDDDGDGVEDSMDAFPLDSTESLDTDNDGVGDSTDAYPSDAACSVSEQGDGSSCYATVFGGVTGIEVIAVGDDFYLYAPSIGYMVIYHSETGEFAFAFSIPSYEEVVDVEYSQIDGRFYFGRESGRIDYYQVNTATLAEGWVQSSGTIFDLLAVDDMLFVQSVSSIDSYWTNISLYSRTGALLDEDEIGYRVQSTVWHQASSKIYGVRGTEQGSTSQHFYSLDVYLNTNRLGYYWRSHGFSSTVVPHALVAPSEQGAFVLSSGQVFNFSNQVQTADLQATFDDAAWLPTSELVVAAQVEQGVTLTRYDSTYLPVEQVTYGNSILIGLLPSDEAIQVIYIQDSIVVVDEFMANNDFDNDGVSNLEDAFPTDAAASVDTDRDGYPDAWHEGYTAELSTTGLTLDAFAQDSACFAAEHGAAGVCDIAAQTPNYSPDQIDVDQSGIVYLMDTGAKLIYRWSPEQQNYLNPINVSIGEGASPNTFTVSDSHDRLYVTYDNHHVYSVALDGLGPMEHFYSTVKGIERVYATGNYLYAVERSEYSHNRVCYVLSPLGVVSDFSHCVAPLTFNWLPEQERFTYLWHGYDYGIRSSVINQLTGRLESEVYRSFYHDESRNGEHTLTAGHVILSSGAVFTLSELNHVGDLGIEIDASYSEVGGGVYTFTQDDEEFEVRRWGVDWSLLEQRTVAGTVVDLVDAAGTKILVSVVEGAPVLSFFQNNNDTDGDGVENLDDAFPNDPAAALDSDMDGYPDTWNENKSIEDSTTGLALDAFPDDHACQTPNQSIGELCDYAGQIPSRFTPQSISIDGDGIIWLLNSEEGIVYRWSTQEQAYIDSVSLEIPSLGLDALAASMVYFPAADAMLVAYSHGVIRSYEEERWEAFSQVEPGTLKLAALGDVLLVRNPESRYSNYVVDASGALLQDFYDSRFIGSADIWHDGLELYVRSDHFDIEKYAIDSQSGELTFIDNRYTGSYTNNVFVSFNGDYIGVSGAGLFDLETLEDVDATVPNFLHSVATENLVLLASSGNDGSMLYYLDSFDFSLLREEAIEGSVLALQPYGDSIWNVHSHEGIIQFNRVSMADTDEDGMPAWWEQAFGLDDSNAADAALDADDDGVVNLDEFVNHTRMNVADTDEDGVSDFDEIFTYLSSPLSQDSDGDTLPDGWEVQYGLDPIDMGDASLDADSDGFSNLVEFQEGSDPTLDTSQPDFVDSAIYSFSSGIMPTDLGLSADTSSWQIDGTQSSDSDGYSLLLGEESAWDYNGIVIDAYFIGNDISLDVSGSCNSFSMWLDGALYDSVTPETSATTWTTLTWAVPAGRHEVEIRSRCTWSVDNIQISPVRSLLELGAILVTLGENRIHAYDANSDLVRSVIVSAGDYNWAQLGDGFVNSAGDVVALDAASNDFIIYRSTTHHVERKVMDDFNVQFSGVITGFDNIAFVLGREASSDQDFQIAKVDLTTQEVVFFGSESYIDLAYVDGTLYAKTDGVSIEKYNPLTLESLGVESSSASGIFAVQSDGTKYFSPSTGTLLQSSSDGSVIETLTVSDDVLVDLDVNDSGHVLAMARYYYGTADAFLVGPNLTSVMELELESRTDLVYAAFVPVTDEDEDGLPTWWEDRHGLNDDDASDAALDADSDGVVNLDEFFAGLDPLNEDSDSDTLLDGEELNTFGTNALSGDTDGDTLSDADELNEYLTDPLSRDSDGDVFDDAAELFLYGTDPINADSLPDALTSYTESFESGVPASWQAGVDSDANWFIATDLVSEGGSSLRSGAIGDRETSAIGFRGLFEEGTLTLDAKVESEACCDILRIYVGDVMTESVRSGDWQSVQIPLVAGEHQITFVYYKDGSVSDGEDAAWIDNVVFSAN